MTHVATTHTGAEITLPCPDTAFLDALTKAIARAARSYFDQHIIRMDDGRCWVADDGDYQGWMQDLEDRIVHTVSAGLSDDG